MIKKIPLPMAGLILSFFAIGNLLASYSANLRLALNVIGAIAYVLYLAKILTNIADFKEQMKNPVIAGVFATFTMATMLLGAFIKPFVPVIALPIWAVGVLAHITLICYFVKTFVIKKDIKLVFPTWFVVFVGIVVASVTAPSFGMLAFGKFAFYFGLISYIVLIHVVCKRVFHFKNIPDPAFATVAIFTAPGGLLLAGYMNSFEAKNTLLIHCLLAISIVFYLYFLSQLPAILKQNPMPSISAITFPSVITAMGFKLTNGFFTKSGVPIPLLSQVVLFMEVVAVVCVAIATMRYTKILTKKD